MISEWLTSLFAKSIPGAKKLGLVDEAVAIRARYERHKRNWRPHIERTKSTITSALAETPKNRAALVLGAGECIDIPLSSLVRHRAGGYLLDAVNLPAIRGRIRPYSNIDYILYDVTGFIDDSKKQASMPKLRRRPGLIVSCNMLSQIYLPFVNFPPQDEDDLIIQRMIVEEHIKMLKYGPAPALLISDYKKIVKQGDQSETYATLPADLLEEGALLGPPENEWDWDICPTGELGKDIRAQLKVGVWRFPYRPETPVKEKD
ncbi:hypothetical protein QGN29_08150 [Temperatibacter marinus]|uniref:Uncharacterized protein n=1 Tax=Temperatibacter marinus TaxID=1456591 RepID=A0AA52EB11_9PROT|nr:hypothetical protein [Temperatibacter marinus]WND01531.1 hypothetical protein QGN29_08150 [Temperatibacter marinus]